MADKPKQSRRAFLAGRAAVEAAGAFGEPPAALPPLVSTVGAQPGSHLLSVSREAMACLFEIVFDAARYSDRSEAAVTALDLVEALEAQLTVYRETSEVARINRLAGQQPVEVEPGLFVLLKRAVELSRATGGAFDITTGRLSKVWGFYRRQGRMPSQDEIGEALRGIGADGLVLEDETQSVRFTRPGIELNLGAIGKGYTLDRVAADLQAGGIDDFLVHGGNSSVLARGSRVSDSRFQISDSTEPGTVAGWTVSLKHPLRPEMRLAEFVLRDQALGTSGSGTQFFHYQGRRYGHIIDPRTGWPAEQVVSATVIAPTAEQADALSTAFYVLGTAAARDYCDAHPEIAALLCEPTKSGLEVELQALNLSLDAWRRC
jgi:thiamine biosynthesis lipoprotein